MPKIKYAEHKFGAEHIVMKLNDAEIRIPRFIRRHVPNAWYSKSIIMVHNLWNNYRKVDLIDIVTCGSCGASSIACSSKGCSSGIFPLLL